VQILAPDVFIDEIHTGLEALRSHQHAVVLYDASRKLERRFEEHEQQRCSSLSFS
jgi:hypothetical protein